MKPSKGAVSAQFYSLAELMAVLNGSYDFSGSNCLGYFHIFFKTAGKLTMTLASIIDAHHILYGTGGSCTVDQGTQTPGSSNTSQSGSSSSSSSSDLDSKSKFFYQPSGSN